MLYMRLIKQLRNIKEELISLIAQGNLEDHAAYRYQTGKLKGTEEAIELVKEIFKGEQDE